MIVGPQTIGETLEDCQGDGLLGRKITCWLQAILPF